MVADVMSSILSNERQGALEMLKSCRICTERAAKFAVPGGGWAWSIYYIKVSQGRGRSPARHLEVLLSCIHPEGFQTEDDPEARYLLAGMDVAQSLWREADVSLAPAPNPSPAGWPWPLCAATLSSLSQGCDCEIVLSSLGRLKIFCS